MTQPTHNEAELDEFSGVQVTPDQQRFLAELNGMEQQAEAEQEAFEADDPEAEQQSEAEAQAQADIAHMTAWGGVATIEFALKQVIHPEFAFTAETKAYAVENMSPLLIKYGALLPDWIAEYEAEINAAKAAARMVSEGISTTKALKAKPVQDAEPAAADQGAERV